MHTKFYTCIHPVYIYVYIYIYTYQEHTKISVRKEVYFWFA